MNGLLSNIKRERESQSVTEIQNTIYLGQIWYTNGELKNPYHKNATWISNTRTRASFHAAGCELEVGFHGLVYSGSN